MSWVLVMPFPVLVQQRTVSSHQSYIVTANIRFKPGLNIIHAVSPPKVVPVSSVTEIRSVTVKNLQKSLEITIPDGH